MKLNGFDLRKHESQTPGLGSHKHTVKPVFKGHSDERSGVVFCMYMLNYVVYVKMYIQYVETEFEKIISFIHVLLWYISHLLYYLVNAGNLSA